MYYGPEKILSNFRIAEVCCSTCIQFNVGYEGEGDCRILLQKKEEKEAFDDSVIVGTAVMCCDVCDYWKAVKQTAGEGNG